MKLVKRSLFLFTLPLVTLRCLASISAVRAQISSDGTLSTTVNITNGIDFTINNGNRAGGNLFHSFREFSVPTGGSAFFNNALDVQNIISRVTGGSISSIDGLIRANGSANLFLLNPAGIIFGSNAQLNIGGSFLASTASSFQFPDGREFSATDIQVAPLLTVNIPNGLRFRENPQPIRVQGFGQQTGQALTLVGGNISLEGGVLQAPGNRVEVGGLASPGIVEIRNDGLRFPEGVQRADVSLTNQARIDVSDRGQGSVVVTARNIDISQGSRISAGIKSGLTAVGGTSQNVTLDATGVVRVVGIVQNNQLIQGSEINNVVESGATGNAGNININASKVEVIGGQIRTRTLGNGDAGNINIKAGEILVDNPAYLFSANELTSDDKPAIDASNFSNNSIIGTGHSGNVLLDASGSIALIGRSQDNANDNKVISTFSAGGQGRGDISLLAKGSISLENASFITSTFTRNTNAGNILLQGDESVSLTKNSSLVATSFRSGNSGNFTLKSSGTVLVENSLISANIGAVEGSLSAQGNAGTIYLSGKSVFVTAGSEVTARNALGGIAGKIQIDATDRVEISGRVPELFSEQNRSGTALYSTLLTSAEENSNEKAGDISINVPNGTLRVADGASLRAESQGNFRGGNIAVNAKRVELTGGGKLLTSASQSGDAGNITISASELIDISGSNPNFDEIFNQTVIQYGSQTEAEIRLGTVGGASGIYASTSEMSTGKSGDINLITGEFIIQDGAQVSVSSRQSQAGNLEISARTIRLNNGSLIAETGSSSGNQSGANIRLQGLELLSLQNGSLISARANLDTNANGGNITIDAARGFVIAFPRQDNDIIANASAGRGGNIQITSQGIFGLVQSRAVRGNSNNEIDASSSLGAQFSGSVEFITPEVDPSQGLVELSENFVDPTQQIAQNPCQQGGSSAFIITGRGGIPSSPDGVMSSNNVRVDLLAPVASTTHSGNATITQPSTSPTTKQIVPTQGWVFNDKGEILLTAYDPTSTGLQRSWQTPASCNPR